MLPAMPDSDPAAPPAAPAAAVPALPAGAAPGPTAAGRAALAQAEAFACGSAAPATLRAYQADWQHFAT